MARSAFHDVMLGLDYPLFIATVAAGGERDGCLIGFATQCSIDPPRFLACISDKNRTFRIAERADVMVVHVVPEEERELAELFGGETADEVDKLGQVEWEAGPGGAPVLARCPRWFAGRIAERVDLGDHHGYLLEPIEAEASEDASELDFQEARDISPGHEP
jgi:flavin reductase (DIM6/NTAB) family NADH-FMN oxidoreductase RutF